ncbi:hypothetical protein [Microvirga terricola]|uniref:Uncharacterized protein n=1 Tax=Microvirga terricola TaxID=2719797 RepID=A0ABX0V9I0_9HYPH|nr:hypothetical protein [Microvirga terricola]NIX76469.1 hypothetical protein [Microvirga terricola]
MHQHSHNRNHWYDDDSTAEDEATGLTGLPLSWRHYGWWIAGIAYSIIWMTESWTSGGSAPGMTGIDYLAQSLWRLCLALLVCWGIFAFFKHRVERLAPVLCILGAVVILLRYGL